MIEDLAYNVALYYGKKNNKLLKAVGGSIDSASANYLSDQIISVVKKHANVVSAAGIADAIPGGATIAVTAIVASTWKMYYDINQCIGLSFSENFLKSVASGVVSNLASNGVSVAAHAGANMLSFIPVVGNIAAAAGGVAANRAAIYTAATSYLSLLKKVADEGGNINESSFKSLINGTYKPKSEVEQRVVAIIVDKLGVDTAEVKPEASFTNDLGADSLDTVELIMEIEKSFGISIPDDVAEQIKTVGDAIRYIETHSN